jgi:hypothetical protein
MGNGNFVVYWFPAYYGLIPGKDNGARTDTEWIENILSSGEASLSKSTAAFIRNMSNRAELAFRHHTPRDDDDIHEIKSWELRRRRQKIGSGQSPVRNLSLG